MTDNFDGNGTARRREGASDGRETAIADDAAELVSFYFFTLVIG
jgi:hypothetical protein